MSLHKTEVYQDQQTLNLQLFAKSQTQNILWKAPQENLPQLNTVSAGLAFGVQQVYPEYQLNYENADNSHTFNEIGLQMKLPVYGSSYQQACNSFADNIPMSLNGSYNSIATPQVYSFQTESLKFPSSQDIRCNASLPNRNHSSSLATKTVHQDTNRGMDPAVLTQPKPQKTSKKSSSIKMNASNHKFCSCGLTPKQAYVASKVLTETNLGYLKSLNNYDYKIREREHPVTGKKTLMYICQFKGGCHKEFERCWNLLDHCRMHFGVKPYSCPKCDRRFTQKGNLNKHLGTHK
ncbi:unnamed protein product [Moneuplotes crassus]|uniref:C2H2-type domain-containing protein n=1 Tax=Euplotes crassus TaxID=5936 RepID=A0AAD1XV26_EUPCR|nr:unnamed protein product [Moneuplotes crassus]